MIQSLQRAFQIARYVSESPEGLRLVDLSRLTGLNKTTVFHLAETLVAEKLLAKHEGALYRLGPLCARLQSAAGRPAVLRRALERLSALHRDFPKSNIVYAELGDADLFSRFSFSPGNPGVAEITDDLTLNPYLTVSGVLFAAFSPSERLLALRLRHPFEFKGREAWGSEGAYLACVAEAARRGWAETPTLIKAHQFKVGIPVRDANGALLATITFTAESREIPPAASVRERLLETARQIGHPPADPKAKGAKPRRESIPPVKKKRKEP